VQHVNRREAARAIVVVEDHKDARDALQLMLEHEGHRVFTAENGVAGLDLIRATLPDVALIDLRMPEMDGYTLAQRLRTEGADLYLIALTGYGATEDRAKAMTSGFDAYLTKPAEWNALRLLIDNSPRHA
jgi:CheY-like chemotaxis protein